MGCRAGAQECAWLRYVEVHMEQGPVLEELGVPLAPVSAIAGQTRLSVSIHGNQVCPDQCTRSRCRGTTTAVTHITDYPYLH